jgi:transglutaminase-like putative cysteine protease
VWVPLATSDVNQKVVIKNLASPVPTRITQDAQYGNRMAYAEIHDPGESKPAFTVEYEVTRKEYSKGDYGRLVRFDRVPQREVLDLQRFLQPDRLVPIDGRMAALAQENTRGQEGAVSKAHALYDYVFKTVRYDKSGTGWGRGDVLWVCDARHGNCTDFHSLFIAMARAQNIPARFEIGFPLPESADAGTIPGYHCWAEFYVGGAGWVPVDISEA